MTRDRWSWVFWLLALLALFPVLACALEVHQQLTDPELRTTYGELATAPFGFSDEWAVATSRIPIGWPAVVSALLTAGLGFVVTASTPGWLVVPRGRQVVAALAVVCLAWAAGTAVLTSWSELSAPTAWEQEMESHPLWYSPGPSWVPDVAERLVAATLAGAVAVLTGWPPGSAREVRGPRASRRRRAASAR